MLTQRIQLLFERSREHWLFVPLFIMLILSFVYVFFIGEKGLLAYRARIREREVLKVQIENFAKQKEELKQKLAALKDNDTAVTKFSKDFYLFQEKVRILKFREATEEKQADVIAAADLATTQKFYTIFTSIVIALVTLFFYRRNTVRAEINHLKPFRLGEDR